MPRILIVDDNRDNANIIRDYLEAMREYRTTVAYDGDDALRLFEEERPAIVLLDVMMPGRDGWEVCRMMKANPELGSRVRIIMVTALDDVLDKRTAIESGADDFLEKPLDFKKLALAVKRNLATLASRVA
jgi:two-component system response regulator VicR